jgi:hypothetical protein
MRLVAAARAKVIASGWVTDGKIDDARRTYVKSGAAMVVTAIEYDKTTVVWATFPPN